jgi:cobalt-zinc-cadmium efflux system protein
MSRSHDDCAQGHTHAHSHAPTDFGRAFAIGTTLNLAFVAAELGFGIAANSLALVADAAHNFADVIGLLLAWGAFWLAGRKPTDTRTYGYRRASILAALANAALLLIAVGAIMLEAVRRLMNPESVASDLVMWVAAAGVVVNTATALLFMRGRTHDLNIRGAFLHMTADAAVSVGVVIAALAIGWTGYLWLDPAVSLVVAAVILATSWSLTRDSFNLALDAVPRGVDRPAVEAYLRGLPGVADVHHLHIWAMSTTETALTAHLVRPGGQLDDALLADATHGLAHRFNICHATLQVEQGGTGRRCALEAGAASDRLINCHNVAHRRNSGTVFRGSLFFSDQRRKP